MRKRIIFISLIIFGLNLVICTLPEPPPGSEDANLSFFFNSPINQNKIVTDTIGNQIIIGVVLQLTQYIDSATVTIKSDTTEYHYSFSSTKKQIDTVYYPIKFATTGIRTVTVAAYIEGKPKTLEGTINIVNRPQTTQNRAPQWNSTKVQASANSGILFSYDLSGGCHDPDNDTLTFLLRSELPAKDTIIGSKYTFTPVVADTGIHSIHIIARDPSGLEATLELELTVSSNSVVDTKAPVFTRISPAKDSTKVSSPSIQVTVSCNDESKIDSVKCFMGTTSFNVTKSGDSTYSATISGLQPSAWNLAKFIARDASPAKNTCTLSVHLNYDNTMPDNVPPVITFQSPAKDTVISVDSFEVKVSCVDDNNISSVEGYRDAAVFDMEKSASVPNLWTGKVKGLTAGSYSTIKIVAADSSAAKNKDSVSVRIKYDNDRSGPAIVLVTPSKDSVTTNTSSYTVVLKVTDPSGVLSVNGASGATAYTGVKDTGSTWKIDISTLENNKVTTIVLTATDSSLKANKTLDTVYIRSEIANGHVITFNKNDNAATGTMTKQTINSGASAPLAINAFVKTGWTFDGWATSPTSAVVYKDGANYTMGNAEVTLYAKWSVIVYNITFDKNDAGASGTMLAQPISAGSSAVLTANAFIKAGATFAGWATSATGDVLYSDEDNYTIGTADVTLYAKWTQNVYTITFNKNDAAATGTMSNQTITSGVTAPLNSNTFLKTGWTFAGWATTSNGSVTYTNGANYIMGTANVILYAKWTVINHIITFNANDTAAIGSMNPQTFAEGTSSPLTPNGFSKAGWDFAGWATSSSGPAVYNDQDVYTMGSVNVTLYAKWAAKNLMVTFDKNDLNATGTMTPQTIASGSVVPLKINAYQKTGWDFTGWALTASGPVAYSDQDSYTMGTANVTLYAKWTPKNYTITFNANGMGGFMNPQTIACGSSENIKPLTFGDGGCHTFVGWATTANGTAEYGNQAKITMGASDVTLYAIWKLTPLVVSPSSGQTVQACITNPITVTISAGCAASYEWHYIAWGQDNVVINGGTFAGQGTATLTIKTVAGMDVYCTVKDSAGNTVKSGTWSAGPSACSN